MKTITYNQDDLEKMTEKQRLEVFMKAVKITGTAVVRDKNGNIKYDEPERAGNYGEEVNGTRT